MKPLLLCILDGWGIRTLDDDNGLKVANYWASLLKQYPHSILQASESFVGLPDGQMGNSEVGHMTIGLGRKMLQQLPKISEMIKQGEVAKNPEISHMISYLKASQKKCHVIGLLSDGGVHSHQDHIEWVCKYLSNHGVNVVLHAVLDGRDTPPKSAFNYLHNFQKNLPNIEVASLSGRFFTMDRDQRWERTEEAYQTIASAKGNKFDTPLNYINTCYNQNIFDEFIPPACNKLYSGMEDGDTLFICNFRADRVRQILRSFLMPDFSSFTRGQKINFKKVLTFGKFASDIDIYTTCVIPKITHHNSLGEVIAKNGLRQLRIAETEKYAHVTFFLNGGHEKPFEGEERILVPSPKVKTYDLKPEMSAQEVTEKVKEAIKSDKYALIVLNFANPDMVGHTGVKEAILKAISTVDRCLKQLTETVLSHGMQMLITADHGNAEKMTDASGGPHTAHTTEPVPCVLVNGPKDTFLKNGTLADIAPTILALLEIKQPDDMTGKNLLEK